jgi:hypothetical protein
VDSFVGLTGSIGRTVGRFARQSLPFLPSSCHCYSCGHKEVAIECFLEASQHDSMPSRGSCLTSLPGYPREFSKGSNSVAENPAIVNVEIRRGKALSNCQVTRFVSCAGMQAWRDRKRYLSRREIEECSGVRECVLRRPFDYAAVGQSAAEALSRKKMRIFCETSIQLIGMPRAPAVWCTNGGYTLSLEIEAGRQLREDARRTSMTTVSEGLKRLFEAVEVVERALEFCASQKLQRAIAGNVTT